MPFGMVLAHSRNKEKWGAVFSTEKFMQIENETAHVSDVKITR